jgi:hypothetical protein
MSYYSRLITTIQEDIQSLIQDGFDNTENFIYQLQTIATKRNTTYDEVYNIYADMDL